MQPLNVDGQTIAPLNVFLVDEPGPQTLPMSDKERNFIILGYKGGHL